MNFIKTLTFALCYGWNALPLHLCMIQVQSHASVTFLVDFVKKPQVPLPQLTLATRQTSRYLSGLSSLPPGPPTPQGQAHPPPWALQTSLCSPSCYVIMHYDFIGCSLDQKLLEARDGSHPLCTTCT